MNERMEDELLCSALRNLAAALDEMPNGCGRHQANNLNRAAERIMQLKIERASLIDALRDAEALCLACVYKCRTPERDDRCDGCEYAAGCECILCECGSRFEVGRSGEL